MDDLITRNISNPLIFNIGIDSHYIPVESSDDDNIKNPLPKQKPVPVCKKDKIRINKFGKKYMA